MDPMKTARIARDVRRIRARLQSEEADRLFGTWSVRPAQDEDGEQVWIVAFGDGSKALTFRSREEAEAIVRMWDKRAKEKREQEEFEKVMMDPPKPKEVVAVVADPKLLDDGRFEPGVSYVMEELDPRDSQMIAVYDKFGERREYFRYRFKVEYEEA